MLRRRANARNVSFSNSLRRLIYLYQLQVDNQLVGSQREVLVKCIAVPVHVYPQMKWFSKYSLKMSKKFKLECYYRVRNCAFLVANATKNLVLATRISQLVTRICHLATENFCLVASWCQHKKVNFGPCIRTYDPAIPVQHCNQLSYQACDTCSSDFYSAVNKYMNLI